MNPHIFREYDIRGVAETDLTSELARYLGRALGTFHKRRGVERPRLVVGRDCRLSSDRLHFELCAGLLETGVDIVDIGVVPTPLMYFAVFTHETPVCGGVEITGSHNPAPDNGFKMMKDRGSLYGEDIRTLQTLIEQTDFDLTTDAGTVTELDVLPSYLGFLRGNVSLARTDLRVAIDAGNGAAGPTAVAALKEIGLEPVEMLCDMDGTFPVHHPDPTDPHSLEMLRDKVLSEGLDLGIAFDGDGDRIGVIDGQGNILWGDRLLTLLSRELLQVRPGAAVLGEVKCSQTLYDDIAAHGGRPILWKTGHSLIKTKMAEEGALLAGEMSGHIFFADRYFGFDDAVYVAARLLEILSQDRVPLHERLADVPKTHVTPEIRVPCPDDEKFSVVESVKRSFAKSHDVVTVDGARILFGEGAWGLVRASNTQPVLVLRFEAKDAATLARIRAEVESVVEAARP
jgi:phosphomannomutase/phosphoglucomutase